MIDIDEKYQAIRNHFEKSPADLNLLDRVYETAKKLHDGQYRKDGSPYILHPIEVANILANLDFNVDVVCAGLLQDVVEDCGYTLQEIKDNFNENIAQMVDCVSAIDKTKYQFDENDIFEDKEFIKSSAEEQTFKKLIAIGKKNPMGFAIKFADRLHNLRTIEIFDYNKQLEKVRESERWIIPIAEKLNSEHFYREIKNECFKIVNRYSAKTFLEHYNIYHETNKNNITALKNALNEAFINTTINEIKIKNVREYKVYSDLETIFPNENIGKVSQGQILKVTNYNIYCLYSKGDDKQAIDDVLRIINKKLSDKIKIIDVKIGRFTHKLYFKLKDNLRNMYNLYIMSKNAYTLQKIGTLDGQVDNLIDDENLDYLSTKTMKVKTRSGEVKFVPENSTVLDFAFKLHQDLGFGFKYAIVNDSKTKQPPYLKLNSGDKVEIFVDRDSNGNIQNRAQLKWLAYVNTELAKKNLIKFFEKRLKK